MANLHNDVTYAGCFVLLAGQILQVTTDSTVLKLYQPTTSLESAEGKEGETHPSLEPEKLKYGKKPSQEHKPLTSVFDPRPLRYRDPDYEALAQLRSELAHMATPCCFLHLLGPATDLVASVCHDHSTHEPVSHQIVLCLSTLSGSENIIQLPVKEEMERFKQEMTLSQDQIKEVERNTRAQSDNPIWFEKRRHRITASVCGKILQRPTRTTARAILKAFWVFTCTNFVGKETGKSARKRYEEVKQLKNCTDQRLCGLYVHPYHGWLAATPDACRAR